MMNDILMVDKSPDSNPEDGLLRNERHKAVRDCVDSLNTNERAVVLSYYFGDQSLLQIAEQLGITHANAKVRLHRARKQLKKCLQKYL